MDCSVSQIDSRRPTVAWAVQAERMMEERRVSDLARDQVSTLLLRFLFEFVFSQLIKPYDNKLMISAMYIPCVPHVSRVGNKQSI